MVAGRRRSNNLSDVPFGRFMVGKGDEYEPEAFDTFDTFDIDALLMDVDVEMKK